MIAGRYTVLEQPALEELLPLAQEHGVGYVAASVFNSGLLSRPRPSAGLTYDHGPVPPGLLARVDALADLAERYGVQLPDVAAQFPLRHPAVVSVPLGVRTAEEVAENARRCATAIPDELWSELEAHHF
jgi:D-threo-aldose 1-dehydrogenase